MTALVRWRLFLRVRNRSEALRLVDREVLPRLRGECRFVSDDRYWKIPELWECVFEQGLDRPSTADVVFDVLCAADRLGAGWHVTGPSAEGSWYFDGVLAVNAGGRPAFSGLDWAHFDVAREAPPRATGSETDVNPPRP